MPSHQIKKAEKYIVVSTSGKTPKAIELIQQLVALSPKLIAFYGKDCGELEFICDVECIGDGSSMIKETVTTSHPNESLDDVKNLVELWYFHELGEHFELIEV